MSSDTPRTDAKAFYCDPCGGISDRDVGDCVELVPADEARTLERELTAARAEVEALRADAERYRWLRKQHWSSSSLAVVMKPKQAIKLGAACPSHDLLDAAIDAALAKEPK